MNDIPSRELDLVRSLPRMWMTYIDIPPISVRQYEVVIKANYLSIFSLTFQLSTLILILEILRRSKALDPSQINHNGEVLFEE